MEGWNVYYWEGTIHNETEASDYKGIMKQISHRQTKNEMAKKT